MKLVKYFLMALVVSTTVMSCTDTTEEKLNKSEIHATGGEVDDPVEPDRDDD